MDAPAELQRQFWNKWNAETRESEVGEVSQDQRAYALAAIEKVGRRDLEIIDVGCGAGWMCAHLAPFGRVTGTDLADEVLDRARARLPQATFVAGDFMALDLPRTHFDVVLSFEVLSHVADQPAFMAKLASLLKPGGLLIFATQNRPVLEMNNISPPQPGQLRKWVDRNELQALLAPSFDGIEMRTLTPRAKRGWRRIATAGRVRGLMRAITGRGGYEAWLESMGLGWTIFCTARRRA